MHRWRVVMLAVALVICAGAGAQTPDSVAASGQAGQPLQGLEGTYDIGGAPLWIVQSPGGGLAAVIGRSVYPLKQVQGDAFLNPAGQPVAFERDRDGAITAASDGRGRYPRRSAEVPARVRALLTPRPLGDPPWRYRTPAPEADLPTGGLAGAGLDEAAIAALVRDLIFDPAYGGVHSLLVLRHRKLVLEEYFYGYAADEAHDLRSATKSVHGALAGIAVKEGLLRLDTPVWAELADRYGLKIDEATRRVTLADVLDMRTGLACDDFDDASPGRETLAQKSTDWVEFLLGLPPRAAASRQGHYCSMAVVAVGRLIELKSGEPLANYARKRLFDPIGIDSQRVQWDFSPTWKGDTHVAGLFMTPRDVLRFGRLYLDGGKAHARAILPGNWTQETFDATTRVGSWRLYSRFWWTWEEQVDRGGSAERFTLHAAMGNGGQQIIVVPGLDAIIVMTGGNFNAQDPSRRIIARIMAAMRKTQDDQRGRR